MRAVIAATAFAACLPLFAAPGDLDPAFGVQGVHAFDFPPPVPANGCQPTPFPPSINVRSVRSAPGSRILVLGYSAIAGASCSAHVGLVARLKADGSPDNTFNTSGLRYFEAGIQTSFDRIVIQPDGRMLVLGVGFLEGVPSDERARIVVARLLADGSLDPTFGTAGAIIAGTSYTAPQDIWLRADGSFDVLSYGGADFFNKKDIALRRFLPDGTPDATFGTAGVKLIRTTVQPIVTMAASRMADGRTVLAYFAPGTVADTSIARLLENGDFDPEFGGGTFVPANLSATGAGVQDLAVHPDGRVVLVGSVGGMPSASRLMPNGALDTTFGANGHVFGVFPTFDGFANTVVLQLDGRIVVGGRAAEGAADKIGIARLNADGSPDTTLKGSGYLFYDFDSYDSVTALSRQDDGKLLVVVQQTDAQRGGKLLRLLLDDAGDTDGDSMPDAVEAAESRNPAVKDNDVFSVPRWFVMQQYRDFLGREGDSGGVTYWTNQISGGMQRADLINAFFNSGEFQGVGAPVARLYFAFFLRIPDYAGLVFQMNAFRSGTSLAAIANNFSLSPEFKATYGALNNAQYVALLYQNVLGRTAAQAEIDYHVNRLNAGATRGEVMTGFSESPEFIANMRSEIFVTMIYAGMMHRAPDQGGFNFWVNYLDSGNSGLALIYGFLGSQEYRQRFLP